MSAAVSADEIHPIFEEKVAGIRSSTTDAPPPSFSMAPLVCVLRHFRLLTTEDIVNAVCLLPDKQCMSDPLPTQLLRQNFSVLAPLLLERSFILTTFKAAYNTPMLKKLDLVPDAVKSYWPILNQSALSKLLERLVAQQLIDCLTAFKLLTEL